MAWAPLIARQHAVTTRQQLAARGVGRRRVDGARTARRWQTIGRNVVVLHNAPLTTTQRRWTAVLLPGKPAALAGLTSAAVQGLRGFEDPQTHVVLASTCSVDFPDWVTVHLSRRFTPDDISAVGIPGTGIARSLIDAAAWSTSPRRACALLCAGVQQRLTTADELSRELRRAGRVRHVAIMRSVLGDIGGGGHTLAEIDLGPLARRAGLPRPRRQALRREPSGRVRYVDAEFELPDGTVLVVEIDGAVHLKPLSYWDDMNRQNEIVIAGSPVLRFDSVTVRLDAVRVIDQLGRFGRRHGL